MSQEGAGGRAVSAQEQLGIVGSPEDGREMGHGGDGEWSGDESGMSQVMRVESSRGGDTSSAYDTDDWWAVRKRIPSSLSLSRPIRLHGLGAYQHPPLYHTLPTLLLPCRRDDDARMRGSD